MVNRQGSGSGPTGCWAKASAGRARTHANKAAAGRMDGSRGCKGTRRDRSLRGSSRPLVGGPAFHFLIQLLLQGLEVEARALLHRRVVDESLRVPADFLLHEHEAPELVDVPVVVGERAGHTRALEG